MEFARDPQPEVSGTPVKGANTDILSSEEQGKIKGDITFQPYSSANKILEAKPGENEKNIGVFRVTRPTSVKNADLSKVSNCSLPNANVSCPSTINDQKHTRSCKKGLKSGQICNTETGAFVKDKRSGYRNKQSMILCKNNAILLPRPKKSLPQHIMSGIHIQRIPVLNNTVFPLPENESLAGISIKDNNNLDLKSTEIIRDGLTLVYNSNESTLKGNSADHLDQNNNSRVRNTQKATMPTETRAEEGQERNVLEKCTNKTDVYFDVRNNDIKQSHLEQNGKISSAIVSVGTVNYSTQCKGIDSKNELLVPELSQYEFRAFNSISERKHPSSTTNEVQQCQLSMDDDKLPGFKPADNDFNASICVPGVNENHKEIMVKENKDFNGHTVPTSINKTRKRTHKDTEHEINVKGTNNVNTETAKISYIVSNKCANKKTTVKQDETKTISFPKNSKVFQDIESRYISHELKGSTSFEKVFEDKCDIINKVESKKLSEVKDHHLLKLSDKERKYLKSKCYLENDLVNDVRRRFEQGSDNKNEISKKTEEYDDRTDGIQANEDFMKETIHANSNEHEAILIDKISKPGKGGIKEEQNSIRMGDGKIVKKQQTENQYHSKINLNQPVVRLQRLDHLPSEDASSAFERKRDKKQDEKTNRNIKNNISTSKKIYYVVNSTELAKINKPQSCPKSSSNIDSILPARQSLMQLSIGTAVSINTTLSTVFSQSVIKPASLFSCNTNEKASVAPHQQVSISDKQLVSSSSVVNAKDNSNLKQNSREPLFRQKTYSNNLTVKELLKAKRDEDKDNSVTCRQINEEANQCTRIPIHLYGKAMHSNHATSQHATVSNSKNSNSNITKNVVAINADIVQSINLSAFNAQQNVNQTFMPIETNRTICIVNPHAHKSGLADQQIFNAAIHQISLPKGLSENSQNATSPAINKSDAEHDVETRSEKADNKHVFIKIGDQTVIVKRGEEKRREKRRTLPAPKSKRTVTDDYKRKRRRSRGRFTQQMHRKSIRSNLNKLLKESDNTVYKLMFSLDLVPVELIKEISSAKIAVSKFDSKPSTPNKKTVNKANEIEEKYIGGKFADKSRCRDRNRNTSKVSGSMVNIIQINKLEDETVNHSVQQIQVKYRKREISRSCPVSSNVGYQCRLKFAADGKIQKIYVESLIQGLYLVKNTNGDKTKLAKKQKLYTYLVPYPPHIETIPNGSLSIAFCEVFPEKQKSQYICNYDNNDLQVLLDKFFNTSTNVTNSEFSDKRYSSITEKSMSPRCSSPMFYSLEMKQAFDDFIEDSMFASEYAKDNLSKRSETNLTKLELQTTRFSERAMALKIKQNELYESCKRLKSEHKVNIGTKKKKDKGLPNIVTRSETVNEKDDIGVIVLNNPLDSLNEENKCDEILLSKKTTDIGEISFNVDV